VVDFIQVRYFAIFNVADVCITAAAVVLIVAVCRASSRRH
jgi:signal peptidase II